MLDSRFESFLVLCETLSYTKTARLLFVTQPAITQHIQYLEKRYQTKLFAYTGKQLRLTDKGAELRRYVLEMKENLRQIERRMLSAETQMTFRIGATKTIGEYVLPHFLKTYLEKNPDRDADLYVDNTQVLLAMLDAGKIDFALLEGFFDKSAYEYRLLKREEFVGVCSPESRLSGKKWSLDELLPERIIVREEGSGTREILERYLRQYSLGLASFAHESTISNFAAIKELVMDNAGITFLYRPVAEAELVDSRLKLLQIEDFDLKREFNFVLPKNSLFKEDYFGFFEVCREMQGTGEAWPDRETPGRIRDHADNE